MILSLKIENFKAISNEIELNFEATSDKKSQEHMVANYAKKRVKKIAVLYGENASGKSSILEAVDVLTQIAVKPTTKNTDEVNCGNWKPFAFDDEFSKQPCSIFISFIQKDVKYDYSIKFDKKHIYREKLSFYKPKKALVFDRKYNVKEKSVNIKLGTKIVIYDKTRDYINTKVLHNMSLLSALNSANIKFYQAKPALDWIAGTKATLIKPETIIKNFTNKLIDENSVSKEDILRFLVMADFNIHDINLKINEIDLNTLPDFIKKDILKRFDKEDGLPTIKGLDLKLIHKAIINNKEVLKAFDFDDESLGTKRTYALAGPICYAINKNRVLGVDELEKSLHPDVLKQILKYFLLYSKNSQLIFTSHNLSILDDIEFLRNDCVWLVGKNKDCSTKINNLSDFSDIRNYSNLYKAYKANRFGYKPDLVNLSILKELEDENK